MKSSTKGYIIFGVLFVLVSILAFAVPTEKTAAFWIAYTFTVMAYAAQIFIWRAALGHEKPLKSKFFGLPVLHIGIVYLVLQSIALMVFLFVPALPAWSAVVVCGAIVGISAVCMMATDVGISEINRVDAKVQKKVSFIKELQTEVELLEKAETNDVAKSALSRLAEKIRFSDPMSCEALSAVEKKIESKMAELKTVGDKAKMIAEIDLLLDERNKKCKALK